MSTRIWLSPVFSGKNRQGEKVVVYLDRGETGDIYLKRGDDKVQKLSDDTEIEWQESLLDKKPIIKIVLPETDEVVQATGTWAEIMDESSLYLDGED